MTKTCYFCSNVEHDSTDGIVSVLPQYENRWFCSTNCLCQHKVDGLKMKRKKKTNKNSKSEPPF